MRSATYALVALLAIPSQSALGASVRVDFAGSVQSISGRVRDDPNSAHEAPISSLDAETALGGSIHVGTPFSAYFVYDDSDTPSDGYPEGPTLDPNYPPTQSWALYFLPAAAHGEIGGFLADSPTSGAAADVYDNELYLDGALPSYVDMAVGVAAPSSDSSTLVLRQIWLQATGGSPGSPVHGTSLAGVPWDLENFPLTSAHWKFTDGITTVDVIGAVDQLSSVPEPMGASLFALAACALLAARKGFRAV